MTCGEMAYRHATELRDQISLARVDDDTLRHLVCKLGEFAVSVASALCEVEKTAKRAANAAACAANGMSCD
jgi:hypothetical protein